MTDELYISGEVEGDVFTDKISPKTGTFDNIEQKARFALAEDMRDSGHTDILPSDVNLIDVEESPEDVSVIDSE
jgi:hypothetical protein